MIFQENYWNVKIFTIIEKSYIDDLWDYKIVFNFEMINFGLETELVLVKVLKIS